MVRASLLADIIRKLLATGPKKLPLHSNELLTGLQIISKSWDGRERAGRSGGLLWRWQWTFGFHQTPGISWLAKKLLAFR